MIVVYNFVVGVLLMLSSEKLASYAGRMNGTLGRYTRISTLAFGTSIAVLSASIYLVVHTLRIGID